MSLPDPKIMMSLRDLSLAAKTTIDGFLTGANKSVIKGSGVEFSQYRSYMPGDDLRWMDWKMFARSDRYYIRESETETNINVRLLLDASGSMEYAEDGFSKMDYAKYIAACIAYLANSQGDATGLYLLRERGIFSLTPRQGYQNLNRLFYQLQQAGPAGLFTDQIYYKDLQSGGHIKELLVFITDMYQQQGEIYQLLDQLAAMKHEIIVLQIMGDKEMTLEFAGYDTLEDLETGATVQIDARRIKQLYQERFETQQESIAREMSSRNIFHRVLRLNQSPDQALRDFLTRRNRAR